MRIFLRRFLPLSSSSLNLLERFLCILVSLSSSEAEHLAMEIFFVVSDRSHCSTKVDRSPVYGLKPFDINMALWLLGALLTKESTSSDSSSCWFYSNRGGICAILELRSQINPTY